MRGKERGGSLRTRRRTAGMNGIECMRKVARKQQKSSSLRAPLGRQRQSDDRPQPTAGMSSTSSELRGPHEPRGHNELSSTSSTSSTSSET